MTNSTDNEIKVFKIPEWNFKVFQEKIEKLNKRGKKLGMEKVSFNVVEEKQIPDPRIPSDVYESMRLYGQSIPHIKIYCVTVEGEPRLEGDWKFVGTLDHVTIEGATVVNTVPNETVPKKYFKHDGYCDHCKTNRYRKETFVVENNKGETKAVGRNCIKDFLGHSPTQIASFLEMFYALYNDLEDEEKLYSGGEYYEETYPVIEYLEWVASVIRQDGWVPKSAADEDRMPTAGTASYAWIRPRFFNKKEKLSWEKDHKKYMPKDKDKEIALAAYNWVAEMEDEELNEYFHNLKLIVNSKFIKRRMFGYAASIVSSYLRNQERLELQKKEKENIKSEYVGTIKKREDFIVTLVKLRSWENNYGIVWFHEFRDEEGRTLIWKSSSGRLSDENDNEIEKGVKVKIKATVINHKKYNEIKQTQVNRVKFLEIIDKS